MRDQATTEQALTIGCRGCGAEPGAWCRVGKVKPLLLVGYVHTRRRAAFRSVTGASAEQLQIRRVARAAFVERWEQRKAGAV